MSGGKGWGMVIYSVIIQMIVIFVPVVLILTIFVPPVCLKYVTVYAKIGHMLGKMFFEFLMYTGRFTPFAPS